MSPSDLFYAPYELKPLANWNSLAATKSRQGFLIQAFDGFAGCQPWPELGDDSVEKQLESLRAGRPTRLAARALWHAQKDGRARRAKKSLFENLKIPSSHASFSIVDGDLHAKLDRLEDFRVQGFKKIKIKVGRDLQLEGAILNELFAEAPCPLKLRLDFNETPSLKDLAAFLDRLQPGVLDLIDFLEDPVTFQEKEWFQIQEHYHLHLGLDRGLSLENIRSGAFDICVVKPALVDPKAFVEIAANEIKRLVVTSYMDHPLGQSAAAQSAAELFVKEPLLLDECGLLSHTIYETTSYSEHFKGGGPILPTPPGTGYGFDELLEKEAWKKLI